MALKIEEFDVNYITAVGGKSVNGLKFANFKYDDEEGTYLDKFPRIRVYGGVKIEKGKYGNYFNLDIKDKETEEFIESLVETLLSVSRYCLDEKPLRMKSPLIGCSGSYTLRCKIYPNSQLDNLRVGEYKRGYCEISPYRAFTGITLEIRE